MQIFQFFNFFFQIFDQDDRPGHWRVESGADRWLEVGTWRAPVVHGRSTVPAAAFRCWIGSCPKARRRCPTSPTNRPRPPPNPSTSTTRWPHLRWPCARRSPTPIRRWCCDRPGAGVAARSASTLCRPLRRERCGALGAPGRHFFSSARDGPIAGYRAATPVCHCLRPGRLLRSIAFRPANVDNWKKYYLVRKLKI